ncbi:N-acetyldiaminopimelate deacetylase [compost metagenome]
MPTHAHAFALRSLAAAALLAFSLGAGAQAQPAASPQASAIPPLVDAMYPRLDALYKDLHAHPELAFKETRTAALLAAEMRAIGFEVTEKVGGTGVVALYRNGPGPVVMVRTDMDGLPMEEKTGLPYASQARTDWGGRDSFVAHSCGHDIHMASWLGTARTLVALKDQWKGTLMFIGQPAEETVSGAKAMLADGLFTRFPKPDAAFALHTAPTPHGAIGYGIGISSSNSDALEIVFKGRGGHGSRPHTTIDPIVIAARFVTDVQAVVSREKDPAEFGVVTIGAIQGGTAGNIIPDTVTLRGTIRSYKPQVREQLLAGVRRMAMAAAATSGAPEPVVKLVPGGEALVNDEAVVTRAAAALQQALGAAQVVQSTVPSTGSEDFSAFINAGVPSMYFTIGVLDARDIAASAQPGGKPLARNHSPFFAPVPEPSIKTGVHAMTVAVLSALGR